MVKPIFWHQGLFLQPHHFQLNDLYNRSLLDPWYKYNVPYFWGVGHVDIDQGALANFVFDVPKGEFIFPDYSHVILGDNAQLYARSFETAWADSGKSFTVYIGIKKLDHAGSNVGIVPDLNQGENLNSRFIFAGAPQEMDDIHGDGPKAEIKQMQFLVKIFWETEIKHQGNFHLIPIARLKRSLEEVKIDTRFIPPCLCLSGCDTLSGIVKEIRDQLSAKARQLESVKRTKGVHTAEFGSRDMVYMMALRSLNRYLPLLEHVTGTTLAAPWSVYGILRQIIGELSSFSAEVSANGELADGTTLVTDYDHKQLWECFTQAQHLITRLLDEITAGPEYIIPLHFDGTYFTAELAPNLFEGSGRFYLMLESEASAASVTESVKHIAKLSARESLPILIAQSLPGARLNALETIPQELPRKSNAVYFQIDHTSKLWAPVEAGNNIALYWDTAPDDLKVELMIVRRN
nr:type VI secretion system baseplate subunit TssK [uncultured Desulfobacter sp.]